MKSKTATSAREILLINVTLVLMDMKEQAVLSNVLKTAPQAVLNPLYVIDVLMALWEMIAQKSHVIFLIVKQVVIKLMSANSVILDGKDPTVVPKLLMHVLYKTVMNVIVGIQQHARLVLKVTLEKHVLMFNVYSITVKLDVPFPEFASNVMKDGQEKIAIIWNAMSKDVKNVQNQMFVKHAKQDFLELIAKPLIVMFRNALNAIGKINVKHAQKDTQAKNVKTSNVIFQTVLLDAQLQISAQSVTKVGTETIVQQKIVLMTPKTMTNSFANNPFQTVKHVLQILLAKHVTQVILVTHVMKFHVQRLLKTVKLVVQLTL